jgi:hypothetical protein
MRNRSTAWSVIAALVMCLPVALGQSRAAKIQLPHDTFLTLEVRGKTLRATETKTRPAIGSAKATVAVDSAVLKAVHGATEIIAISARAFPDGNRSYFVLAVATPSVEPSGGGFCGAGTEDRLLLIEWQGKVRKLVLRDQFEIQSCLKSIALRSDRGSDLPTLLGKVGDPTHIQLTWLEHPKYHQVTTTLTAQDGKFVVAE